MHWWPNGYCTCRVAAASRLGSGCGRLLHVTARLPPRVSCLPLHCHSYEMPFVKPPSHSCHPQKQDFGQERKTRRNSCFSSCCHGRLYFTSQPQLVWLVLLWLTRGNTKREWEEPSATTVYTNTDVHDRTTLRAGDSGEAILLLPRAFLCISVTSYPLGPLPFTEV